MCCFIKLFFSWPLMVFRQRILPGPASSTIACYLHKPICSRIGNSKLNENRNFIITAHRPVPASSLAKSHFSVNPNIYKVIARSKATAALGHTAATGRSSENAAGWSTITLWQSGITRPQPVEISRETRTIRGNEKTMQVFSPSVLMFIMLAIPLFFNVHRRCTSLYKQLWLRCGQLLTTEGTIKFTGLQVQCAFFPNAVWNFHEH